jgi:hypothetical protein
MKSELKVFEAYKCRKLIIGQPNPEKNINEFADLLISKLSAVKKDRETVQLLNHRLDQIGDGDSSVASAGHHSTADQRKKRFQHQQQVRFILYL